MEPAKEEEELRSRFLHNFSAKRARVSRVRACAQRPLGFIARGIDLLPALH